MFIRKRFIIITLIILPGLFSLDTLAGVAPRLIHVGDTGNRRSTGRVPRKARMNYMTVRMYFEDDHPSQILERGLTLEEAREHCSDPETSSSTCTNEEGLMRTQTYGPWFDGYEEEE